MSYLTESEAPRDFRVSSTESDGHYTKCVLCYTVKRNFYCADCVRSGNFVHSSMPYSDRFSEKQIKLMRIKVNRQHVLERCEKLLAPKLKKDILVTETKQSRDKLDLLRLAIDQRRSIIDNKRKELTELKTYNNELRLKLPRYQKRVASLGKHAQTQRIELQTKISLYGDQMQSLAALRRSRIRQLTRYIFPIYMSYDLSDSIEDLEFLGEDVEEEPPKRPQLHIVAPWIDINADYSHIQAWVSQNKDAAVCSVPTSNPAYRTSAALGLAAQLVALLAWTLDVRLPHAIALRYRVQRPAQLARVRGARARGRHGAVRARRRAALRGPRAARALPRARAAGRARRAARAIAGGRGRRPRPRQGGAVVEPVERVRGVAVGGAARGAGRARAARAPALARQRADGRAELHPPSRSITGDVGGRLHRLDVAGVDKVTCDNSSL